MPSLALNIIPKIYRSIRSEGLGPFVRRAIRSYGELRQLQRIGRLSPGLIHEGQRLGLKGDRWFYPRPLSVSTFDGAIHCLLYSNHQRPDIISHIPNGLIEKALEFGYLHWPYHIRPYVQGKKVLDVGCGTGLHGIGYVVAGASEYVGLDPNINIDESRGKNKRSREWEDFGFTGRQIMEAIPATRLIPGDFSSVRPDDLYDVVVMHNVTEHLLDIESVLSAIPQLLRPNGILLFNHHNYFSWNGHHKHPKKVSQIDCEKESHREYMDWNHVHHYYHEKEKISEHLNALKMIELREIVERYFTIDRWQSVPSTVEFGAGRFRRDLLRKYPDLTRHDFLTQHVFCIARKKE